MGFIKKEKFFRIFVLIAWFLFFLSLLVTGKLQIFIKKTYNSFVVFAVVTLFILIILHLKRIKKEDSPDITFMQSISFLLFLFPILLAIIVRPGSLSTFAVSKLGMSTEFQASNADVREILKSQVDRDGQYRKLNIKQILSIANKNPEKINGSLVSVEGLVYKNNGSSENFSLVQYLIACCVAHARPLALEVIWDQTKDLPQDSWVKVKGKVEIEKGKIRIISDEVTEVPKPSNSYLY